MALLSPPVVVPYKAPFPMALLPFPVVWYSACVPKELLSEPAVEDCMDLDPKALFLARQAIKQGFDRACTDIERTFIYLPFEHSEDLQVQVESVALFDTIDNELNQQFARRHLEIIERFGRFPHRNDVLGRVTTAAEREFLKESDSAF